MAYPSKVHPSAAQKADAAGADDPIQRMIRLNVPQLPHEDVDELTRLGCSWLVKTMFLAQVRVPAKSLAAVAALDSVTDVR